MRASLGILAGTALVAVSTVGIAGAAAAATLPAGQRISIVQYLDSSDPDEGQFFDVNPADAAATPVGTATDQVILGLEVGDDGVGAAIGQLDSESTIWTANAATGTVSNPQTIALNGDVELDSCGGIDLVNETFIISCVEAGDPAVSHVGSVDPATGVFTSFLALSGEDFIEFDALANDEVTAQLWGFAEIAGASHSFTIDLENDIVAEVAEMDDDVHAADFDRNGQLFVSTDVISGVEFTLPALAVADPTTGAYSFLEPYVSTTTDTALIFVAALSIWGAAPEGPALAATGSEILPIGLGALFLVLAGITVAVTRRTGQRSA